MSQSARNTSKGARAVLLAQRSQVPVSGSHDNNGSKVIKSDVMRTIQHLNKSVLLSSESRTLPIEDAVPSHSENNGDSSTPTEDQDGSPSSSTAGENEDSTQ
ncbi:hypothetical protein BGZ76_005523 [Entomortierella beljakovae]|nr:hypothetical protein BGZ76_005523 [Entomortierella beljakovae]